MQEAFLNLDFGILAMNPCLDWKVDEKFSTSRRIWRKD
jgi:hypothetical protein